MKLGISSTGCSRHMDFIISNCENFDLLSFHHFYFYFFFSLVDLFTYFIERANIDTTINTADRKRKGEEKKDVKRGRG